MALQQNSHALSGPPGQQNSAYHQSSYQPAQQSQRPTTKGRTRSRAFSFRSDKSGGSKENKDNRNTLFETHREKEAKRLHSKADPTMALSEVEPGVVAAQTEQTMDNLRAMQHTDTAGNVITEPDQSNPTRWRYERPLDTIRSFENAIRKRDRSSLMPPGDNESVMSYNIRSSYYGNGTGTPGRYQHASYYSDVRSSRPQSGTWDYQQYPPPQQQQSRWGPPPDRRRHPHVSSESQYGPRTPAPAGNMYPSPGPGVGDTRSYETVASGSGTSGERPGYVTDPTSSENSSIDRRQSPQKRQPEPVDDYGIGFTQPQQYQPSVFTVGTNGGLQHGNEAGETGPPVPTKTGSMLRKPVQAVQQQDKQKKRKSWFSLKGNRD
ncbi:unnamed protein product [Discula destructiva]